jgi:hypothetical protein
MEKRSSRGGGCSEIKGEKIRGNEKVKATEKWNTDRRNGM